MKIAYLAVPDQSDSSSDNFVFPDFDLCGEIIPTPTMIMSNYNQLDPDMFNSSDCKHPELSILSCLRSKMCLRKEILLIQANTVKYWIGHSRSRDQTPYNSACDVLIRGLINVIPESDMFQANAAFRESQERRGVWHNILPSCLYKNNRFTCPSSDQLSSFKVFFSTFISSFCPQNAGLPSGHFSHIFVVDASFATNRTPWCLRPIFCWWLHDCCRKWWARRISTLRPLWYHKKKGIEDFVFRKIVEMLALWSKALSKFHHEVELIWTHLYIAFYLFF